MDRLAIVILNWNNARLTLACVDSVLASREALRASGCDMALYVVDNGSAAPDVASLRHALARLPGTTLVENAANLGFAGGMNAGIEAALRHSPGYVFLLNNDTTIAESATARLYTFAEEHPDCAIIASTIVDPATNTLICAGGYRYHRWLGWSRPLGRGSHPSAVEHCPDGRIDYIDGAAMWFRAGFLARTGGLPGQQFLYFEELALRDLLLEDERQGWCRQALVYHTGGGDDTSRERQASNTYHAALSAFRYTRANHPWCLPTVIAARLSGIALRSLLRLQPWLLTAVVRALRDFRRSDE